MSSTISRIVSGFVIGLIASCGGNDAEESSDAAMTAFGWDELRSSSDFEDTAEQYVLTLGPDRYLIVQEVEDISVEPLARRVVSIEVSVGEEPVRSVATELDAEVVSLTPYREGAALVLRELQTLRTFKYQEGRWSALQEFEITETSWAVGTAKDGSAILAIGGSSMPGQVDIYRLGATGWERQSVALEASDPNNVNAVAEDGQGRTHFSLHDIGDDMDAYYVVGNEQTLRTQINTRTGQRYFLRGSTEDLLLINRASDWESLDSEGVWQDYDVPNEEGRSHVTEFGVEHVIKYSGTNPRYMCRREAAADNWTTMLLRITGVNDSEELQHITRDRDFLVMVTSEGFRERLLRFRFACDGE